MSTMAIPQDIAALIATLTARGYDIVRDATGESFGDREILLAGQDLKVRCIRDRSQWFIEAGPAGGGEWFDISLWREALDGREPSLEPLSFGASAHYVQDNLSRLEGGAANAPLQQGMLLRRRQRARARLRRSLAEDLTDGSEGFDNGKA